MLGRFIAASGFSNLADGVATVAWAWLATLLTRDAMLIAVVPFALKLPWPVFALMAGVVTDRVDRRRLILAADVVRAAAFVVVAGAIWMALPLAPAPERGVSEPWLYTVILGTALAVGVAEVFRDNSAQTMLPALVTDKARLERANGRLWSAEMVGNALVGPAVGSFLIAAALPLPFAVNAVAYALAVVLVARIAGTFRAEREVPRHWVAEVKEGFAFLRANPLLKALALITGAWNLVGQIGLVTLVLHAQENLGMPAPAYGLVLAGGAVGGIIGSLSGGWLVARFGAAPVAQTALVLTVPWFLAMAAAPGAWSLALVFAGFELSGMVWNIISVSYRQRLIPNALFGRVNSLYRLLAWGMIPVGTLLAGAIVRLAEAVMSRGWALEMPFLVAAAGSAMIALAGWRPLARGLSIRR